MPSICIVARPELEGLIASLLCYGIHTFGVKCGWIEPGGRTGWPFRITMRRCEMDHTKATALHYPRVWLYARTRQRASLCC